MCGILLLVQDEAVAEHLSADAFATGLTARGPDHCGAVQVRLPSQEASSSTPACCCLSLHMAASLLQLRSSSPSTSPLADAQGNTLCFNGEVFAGLDIPQGGNDGKALLAALQQASAAAAAGSACEDVAAVLSKLRGPWALIYWQAQQQTLWFGRDVMGKRSLLLQHQHGCLVLTSVTPQQHQQQHTGVWLEVPPGLYSISAHDLRTLLHGASADSSSSGGSGGSAAASAAGRTSTDCQASVPAVLRPAPGAEVAGQGLEEPSNRGVGSAADLCLLMPGLHQHPWLDEQLQQLQHYQRSSDADTAASAAVLQQPRQQKPSQLSAALEQLQLQEEARQQGEQQGVHQWQEPSAVAEQRPDPSQQQQQQQQQQLEAASQQLLRVMQAAVDVRCLSINTLQQQDRQLPSAAVAVGTNTPGALSPAPVLVLFSGGVDSTLIAALAHRALPAGLPIDLSTVCFDGGRSADRVAARAAVLELAAYAPDRAWRLIEVDSSLEEVDSIAQHIKGLLHPAATVMDWNIGSALWLAAKAEGRVWRPVRQPPAPPAPQQQQQQQADLAAEQVWQLQEVSVAGGSTAGASPAAQHQQGQAALEQQQQQPPQAAVGLYKSAARVVMLGHGADEQCGGYGRHRTKFRLAGLPGVAEELALDVNRLWLRNLGRDDRLIADHAREGRHPFLDEDVMVFLQQLPLSCMVDYSKPPGVGDKRILRHLLASLGLPQAAGREKRAIQFGTRLAPLSNKRDFGSNRKANMRQAGSLKMVAQRSAAPDS